MFSLLAERRGQGWSADCALVALLSVSETAKLEGNPTVAAAFGYIIVLCGKVFHPGCGFRHELKRGGGGWGGGGAKKALANK